MVHSGFLTAYDSVKAKLRRIVDQLTADRSPEAPWTVFLTGHSLGGALATLAAFEQAGRK
jgi:alpha-beta hydrolase superfamily lysophospholipase